MANSPEDYTSTHKIESVAYNWYATPENGEEFTTATVGKDGVQDIIEYIPNNGDLRWHYDIITNKGIVRIFNPNIVVYLPLLK